jgi:hypothetical protein
MEVPDQMATNTTETTTTPLAAAIKRLAITKDQKRVLLALADAGDSWTPVTALDNALGRSDAATKRMVVAVNALVAEKLALLTGTDRATYKVCALPVEAWANDDHYTLGVGIRWGS